MLIYVLTSIKAALNTLIEENSDAMDTLKEDIDGLEKTISDNKGYIYREREIERERERQR